MPLVVPGLMSSNKSTEANTAAPVIPSEEMIASGVFDKPGKKMLPKPEHFEANPGPVIPEDPHSLEHPLSREEQHVKAEELNRD
ncbi:hypothetical protein RUND412_005699 [Rhizina undulata]